MRVLVTGGAGFIGSHLAERLLKEGFEVVCLDNFNDFYDPGLKRRNIEKAFWSNRYTLISGDILDEDLLDKVFSEPFDAVAHLAAYAGVRPSIERPEIYERVNVRGTLNLLERCRHTNVPKFVFASSSSVYGGRKDVPFRETDDISRPISPYAASKVAGEALCYTYHHLFGIQVHALRFFTVYGPRQRPEMAIHLFARSMLHGEPITLFGDGESSRDYTYIDDIIDGVTASIKTCKGYEIINLGGSRTTSLNELVSVISRRLNIAPEVEHTGDQPGDVPITFADVAYAAKLLGYAPKVDINDGIDRFCKWLLQEAKRHGEGTDSTSAASTEKRESE
jgi:UDP-glucuronate 4-epimerase